MEHRQRRPCHAGTLPAGTVAPGSVPAPAARHRNGEQTATAHDMHRDAPGAADRTASADRRPEQQRTTRRRPGLFLLPRLHPPATCPACRIGSPARAGCCRRPGEKLESTRGALDTVHGYCARHLHREGSAPPAPHQMTTPAADRRHDDHAPAPALPHLHSAHSLQALPDLTAAAQPPAPPPRRTSPPAPHTCRRLHRRRLPDDPPRRTPQNGHFAPPPEGSDSQPNGIEL